MARKDRPPKTSPAPPVKPAPATKPVSGTRAAIVAAVILLAYLAALIFRADRIPAGLNNDVAEEALRGIYLVEGHHFEVMTLAIGHSAETFYLYLMGIFTEILGPTTFALHLLSWIFAIACIWMIWRLLHRIMPEAPVGIALLTATCSIWLFHYARTGLRAISAPFFLCCFTLLLDRVERKPGDRNGALACGAILGLSLYAYTSARVLPIAFVVYVAYRWLRERGPKQEMLRRYGLIALGALIASIPNIIFFLRQPAEFLSRGSYVLRGSASGRIANVVWTALLPFYYPAEYRTGGGTNHYFDGVSAGLMLGGFNPIHIVFAAALLLGLYQARRYFDKPAAAFLLAAWMTAIATLGIAGPSMTRMLVILPAILVFVALGFAYLAQIRRELLFVARLAILFVGISDGYSYLSGAGAGAEYYAPAATGIGEQAASLASQGHKVLCIISRDSSIVKLLTHKQTAQVRIAEFYERPFNPAELPLNDFQPDVMVLENNPGFAALATRFPPSARTVQDERFSVISLAAR